MAARERGPEHAVAVDVAAAWAVAREGRLIDFGERGCGRVLPRVEPDDPAGEAERGAPDGAIHGIDRDAVERRDDARVLRRIDRLVRLDIAVALAVAVRVEDERGPALRFCFVAGLLEELAVEPADDAARRTAGTCPERVVRVLGEDEMVGREAGADQRERLSAPVVHRQMPVRALEREELRRRVVRALAAELRILGRPDARGEPDAALLVHHRIVDRGLAIPDRLLAPVGRRRHRKLFRGRRLRIAHRHPELRRRVGAGSSTGRRSVLSSVAP